MPIVSMAMWYSRPSRPNPSCNIDVKVSAGYAGTIAEVSARHEMWGYRDGTFRPGQPLRAVVGGTGVDAGA